MSRRPVADGLLYDAGDNAEDSYLIGARCPCCGLVLFPAFWICPRCLNRERRPEPLPISGAATLDRFCVSERGPKVFNPPYVNGFVRLDEGPLVYSLIRGVSAEAPGLQPGQRMQVAVDVVRVDDDGTEVVGWTSRPADAEQG